MRCPALQLRPPPLALALLLCVAPACATAGGPRAPRVVALPFEAAPDDPAAAALADALSRDLALRLAAAHGLDVVGGPSWDEGPSWRPRLAEAAPAAARPEARRLGATRLVAGRVTAREGGGLTVEVRAIATRDGAAIWTRELSVAGADAALAEAPALAAALGRVLGSRGPPWAGPAAPLDEARADALRALAAPGGGDDLTPACDALAEGADADPPRLLEAGWCRLLLWDTELAAAAFRRAAEAAPDLAMAHVGVGLAALRAGDARAAVEALERARALNPALTAWEPARALAYRDLGKALQDAAPARAEELLATAQALGAEASPHVAADAAQRRADLAAAAGRTEEAAARREEAAALFEATDHPAFTRLVPLFEDMVAAAQPAPPAPALPRAADAWDEDAVAAALAADPAVALARDAIGRTLLHLAADADDPRRAERLLEAGADPDAADRLGQSPLHRAAWRGDPGLVATLAAAGARLERRDVHGHTALHRAAWAGHREATARLLALGARPEPRSELGETPLHQAALLDRAAVVPALLASGARPERRTREGLTALQGAVARGSLRALRALCAAPALDRGATAQAARYAMARDAWRALAILADALGPGRDLDLLLLTAARTGKADALGLLIDRGADPQARDEEGRDALRVGAWHGHGEVVRRLLPHGLAPVDAAGRRPLDLALLDAVAGGHADVLALLAGAGARLDVRDDEGRAAAHVAVDARQGDLLAPLAALGGDLEAHDGAGWTPLQRLLLARRDAARRTASRQAWEQTLEALLAAGASPDGPAADGSSPLWLTAHLDLRPAYERLRAAGARPDPFAAAWFGDLPALDAALAASPAAARAVDRDGRTALAWGVRGGRREAVGRLLAAGASPDARTEDGTALHTAILDGREGIAADLVDAGADVEAEAPEARHRARPLHLAAARGLAPLVARLLARGARVDAADARGRTPLHEAAESRSREVVALLLAAGASPDVADASGARPRDLWPQGFGDHPKGLDEEWESAAEEGEGGRGWYGSGKTGGGAGAPGIGRAILIRRRSLDADVLRVRQAPDPYRDAGTVDHEAVLAEEMMARGHYAEAEHLWRELAALLVKSAPPGDPRLPSARQNLGRTLTHRGRYGEARRLLAGALTAFRSRPEAGSRAQATRETTAAANLAEVEAVQGRLAEAEARLAAVVEARTRRLGLRDPLIPSAMGQLASVQADQGRYAAAEETWRAAIRHEGVTPDLLASLLANLGALYRVVGDAARARKLYEVALERLGDPDADEPLDADLRAVVEANLADLLRAEGDLDGARERAAGALARLEAVFGDEHDARPRLLLLLGELEAARGDEAAAAAALDRAEAATDALLGPAHPLHAELLTARGALALAAGRAAEAVATLADAVVLADEGGEPRPRWQARLALGRALAADGRREAAIFVLKDAVNLLQGLRREVGAMATDLDRAFVADKEPAYRALAGLLVDAGRLAEAQEVLDLLKAEELATFVRRDPGTAPAAGAASLDGREAALAGEQAALRGRVAALGREMAALRALPALDEAQKARRRELREELRSARAAFEQALTSLQGRLTVGAVGVTATAVSQRLAAIRGLQGTLADLGPGVAALHTLVLPDRLHLILTTSEVQIAATAEVAEEELNRLVQALREVLRDPRRDPRPAARALYDRVLAPVAADLDAAGATSVLVALDGTLRYVPLAALWDGERWAGERWRFTALTEAGREHLARPADADRRIAALGVSKPLGEFSALPAVPAELRAVAERTAAREALVRLDEAFDADTLLDVLDDGWPILHIASHFAFRPGTWRDSFLLLGSGDHLSLERLKLDGYTFRDVQLLTLSACDTAMGGGARGQEVDGFGALAQNLGAASVLATLWPVADASTAAFMAAFYRLRNEEAGLAKDAAIQRVQAMMRDGRLAPEGGGAAERSRRVGQRPADAGDAPWEAPPGAPWAHPYYWAPFVLMGSFR